MTVEDSAAIIFIEWDGARRFAAVFNAFAFDNGRPARFATQHATPRAVPVPCGIIATLAAERISQRLDFGISEHDPKGEEVGQGQAAKVVLIIKF